jgi:hypothetical protein
MTHRENFLNEYNLEDKSYSLKQLSKISHVPLHILQEVYNRGIGAYKTQPSSVRLRGSYVKGVNAPMKFKLSKEQWAYARVYSFLDGNPKHDDDLRQNRGGGANIKLISVHHSTAKGKKYTAILQEGDTQHTVHFGAKGYQDFTQHNDETRKQRYLSRHKKREDWTDPLTAGFWSRWVLWNLPTLKDSIENTVKRFNL